MSDVLWYAVRNIILLLLDSKYNILFTCISGKYCICVLFYKLAYIQGFMQDKIIASHTCFGGHMDVNC